jgi:hypothetical protein
LKNKLVIQKNYHLQESAIDRWPYWMWEQNIKNINEMADDEERQRKKDDESQQKSMPNFNPSSYMNSMSNMTNKLSFNHTIDK